MKTVKAYSYIRFSTKKQLEGDSLRRQLEGAQEYVEEYNLKNKEEQLVLDQTLNLLDLGLSAFDDTHITKGALGKFLQLVKDGEIAKGSVLIVENLDRLSRGKILKALAQFNDIVSAGLRLVTLTDGMEYTEESINDNWSKLIISITYMARAHDESLLKSKRLKRTWENKRKLAINGKIISACSPIYLTLNKERTGWIVDEVMVKAINKVFQLKLEGMGEDRIMMVMNQDKTMYQPPESKQNKAGGWQVSYIALLLRNRNVIGEYQPQRLIKKTDKDYVTKETVGEVIKNYYPPIVSVEIFNRVQALIQVKFNQFRRGGGATCKAYNLFVSLTHCGQCGGPMYHKKISDRQYLKCYSAIRKKGCTAKPINYFEFQQIMLDDLEELKVSKFFADDTESVKRITSVTNTKESLKHEVNVLNQGIVNLTKMSLKASDETTQNDLLKSLDQTNAEIKTVTKQIAEIEIELESLKADSESKTKSIKTIKAVQKLLVTEMDEEKKINLRVQLRMEIQRIIKKIVIFPHQESYQKYTALEDGDILVKRNRSIKTIKIWMQNVKTTLRIIKLTHKIDTTEFGIDDIPKAIKEQLKDEMKDKKKK